MGVWLLDEIYQSIFFVESFSPILRNSSTAIPLLVTFLQRYIFSLDKLVQIHSWHISECLYVLENEGCFSGN